MSNIKISFEVKDLSIYSVALKNGKKALEIQTQGELLSISVLYDYDTRPLILSSMVKSGDLVEAIFLDYRIELYVNGIIMDEEWPFGKRLFEIEDSFSGSVDLQVSEYTEVNEVPPCVISTFENAEGWYPKNGVFVGDCMPYVRDGEYHVLYLKDRHHHKSKWGTGAHQWEHISTKDFKVWNIHPMAVPITKSDEGSICTGSWIRRGDKEYLYYTIRRPNGLPATISRSVSQDGYHFEKDSNFGFTVSRKYNRQVARDPKVFLGDDGKYHMILTTVLIEENKGCLAHYVSEDLESWAECDKPIYTVSNSDHPECPDYFKYNGWYYLIFSLRGRARYLVSRKPFEGFSSVDDILIPCAGVPKCAEWNGRLIFTGFNAIDGYAGKMTFKASRSCDNGVLIFEDL